MLLLLWKLGKVTHVSVPVPKYGTNSMYNDLVLDITVDVEGKNYFNFKNFLQIVKDC